MDYKKIKRVVENNYNFFLSHPTKNTYKRYFKTLECISRKYDTGDQLVLSNHNKSSNVNNLIPSEFKQKLPSNITTPKTDLSNNYLIQIINNTRQLDEDGLFGLIREIFNFIRRHFIRNWLFERKIDRIANAFKITQALFNLNYNGKNLLIQQLQIDEGKFDEIIQKLKEDEKQIQDKNNKNELIRIFGIEEQNWNEFNQRVGINYEHLEYRKSNCSFNLFDSESISENQIPLIKNELQTNITSITTDSTNYSSLVLMLKRLSELLNDIEKNNYNTLDRQIIKFILDNHNDYLNESNISNFMSRLNLYSKCLSNDELNALINVIAIYHDDQLIDLFKDIIKPSEDVVKANMLIIKYRNKFTKDQLEEVIKFINSKPELYVNNYINDILEINPDQVKNFYIYLLNNEKYNFDDKQALLFNNIRTLELNSFLGNLFYYRYRINNPEKIFLEPLNDVAVFIIKNYVKFTEDCVCKSINLLLRDGSNSNLSNINKDYILAAANFFNLRFENSNKNLGKILGENNNLPKQDSHVPTYETIKNNGIAGNYSNCCAIFSIVDALINNEDIDGINILLSKVGLDELKNLTDINVVNKSSNTLKIELIYKLKDELYKKVAKDVINYHYGNLNSAQQLLIFKNIYGENLEYFNIEIEEKIKTLDSDILMLQDKINFIKDYQKDYQKYYQYKYCNQLILEKKESRENFCQIKKLLELYCCNNLGDDNIENLAKVLKNLVNNCLDLTAIVEDIDLKQLISIVKDEYHYQNQLLSEGQIAIILNWVGYYVQETIRGNESFYFYKNSKHQEIAIRNEYNIHWEAVKIQGKRI